MPNVITEKTTPKIAIIGASGFVGARLLHRLARDHQVIALTRTRPKNLPSSVEWRQIDLFSLRSTTEALKGVNKVIYLVHSMLPSSHLFQGNFHDTDLLLADNFVRGCLANQVEHIVYLGGLMPEGYVSPHLESRLEVEGVFIASGIKLTALRAGMIVGQGGTSFEILRTLVHRLPVMLLPRWTQRTTQAVYIDDVLEIITAAIENPEFENKVIDVVSGEPLTYEILLRQMAEALGKKRWMIQVPIESTQFSKRWVQLLGNSTYELVSPLVDSLLCDLPQTTPSALIAPFIRFKTFRKMVAMVFSKGPPPVSSRPKRKTLHEKSVRSIQKMPSLPNHNSRWIAKRFMAWLPGFFPFLIRVKSNPGGSVNFYLSRFPWPLLTLKYVPTPGDEDRVKLHIVGGLLTATANTGWLEFRQVNHKKYTLAAIHEFVPALPWMIYIYTQAPLHKFVMKRFGKYLEGKA
jgi:uncharacterized protein YbjT (DUF2867 family)